MTTAELRKSLKAIGYKLQVKQAGSLGRYAGIVHIESNTQYGSVEFSDTVQKWDAFNEFVKQNSQAILAWSKQEDVFGVKSWLEGVKVV